MLHEWGQIVLGACGQRMCLSEHQRFSERMKGQLGRTVSLELSKAPLKRKKMERLFCEEVEKWESWLTIKPLQREQWKSLVGAREGKPKVAHREDSAVQGINILAHEMWWIKQMPELAPGFSLVLRFCWSQPCPGLPTSQRTGVPQGAVEGVCSYY